MLDETSETYKWILKAFLKAMKNKHPKQVTTDEDGAMSKVIKHIFLDTCHQLYDWHLQRKACEHIKSSLFIADF